MKRDQLVQVKVTEAEKAAWKLAAQREQRSLSAWIRVILSQPMLHQAPKQ